MITQKDIHMFREKQRILLQTNEYICLSPYPNLKEYISNYNVTFPTKEMMPSGFTIMPCGCSTLSIENDGKGLFVDLDGPTTKPHIVGSQANQPQMIVTIEFRPAGLYALTGINQSELTDQTIAFEAVNPALSKMISDIVEKTESVDELLTGLDMLLLENMYAAYHPQLKQIFQAIYHCAGSVNIKKLSDEAHYSERQLNRIFQQHVGVSGKSFSRLVRINHAFRLLKNPKSSLTFVSDVMGFYDVSHFIRDFGLVCGITPQAYRNNMSDFYINPTKF